MNLAAEYDCFSNPLNPGGANTQTIALKAIFWYAWDMKINVGSKNATKVQAVIETAKEYDLFKGAEVVPFEVQIETFGHPKTIQEIINGAIDRARQSFQDCNYSFGLESGVMPAPGTKTGYFELTACAIYDGQNFHLGLSPAYEWPKQVADAIINKGMDGSQAMRETGLTREEKIGANKGAIDLLTNGRLNRTQYNKLAIMMAMIHLEHSEHY